MFHKLFAALDGPIRANHFPEDQKIVPVVPQSEIRVKFLVCQSEKTGENAAKFWRNFLLIFALLFPGKMAAGNFTQIPPHIRTSNSARREPKILSPRDSGSWGAQKRGYPRNYPLRKAVCDLKLLNFKARMSLVRSYWEGIGRGQV